MSERPQDRIPGEDELPTGWHLSKQEGRYGGYTTYPERDDGAYVWKSDDNFHARPWLKEHRPWMAFPTEDGPALSYRRTKRKAGRRGVPSAYLVTRRWKTALAAIKALEDES